MDYEIGHVNLTEKTGEQKVNKPLPWFVRIADNGW